MTAPKAHFYTFQTPDGKTVSGSNLYKLIRDHRYAFMGQGVMVGTVTVHLAPDKRLRPHSMETRVKMSEARLQKGEDHFSARNFRIKSPAGVVYTGKNLRLFVRDHAELFDPKDCEVRSAHTRNAHTIASKGLASLYSNQKVSSWKGWRTA